jgi:hypothetical protein
MENHDIKEREVENNNSIHQHSLTFTSRFD